MNEYHITIIRNITITINKVWIFKFSSSNIFVPNTKVPEIRYDLMSNPNIVSKAYLVDIRIIEIFSYKYFSS